jgi:hypothetical protein
MSSISRNSAFSRQTEISTKKIEKKNLRTQRRYSIQTETIKQKLEAYIRTYQRKFIHNFRN